MAPPPKIPARPRPGWSVTHLASLAMTALALAFFAAMVCMFLWQAIPVWRFAGLDYLASPEWFYRDRRFGALSMIYGTAVVCGLALLIAAPIGLGAAIFSAEILPAHLRLPYKMLIELLAGIPSVVYGLLAILFLRDWIYRLLEPFDPLSGDTLLTAAILLAVMILPTIISLSDDALRGVPSAHRNAARALGLTRAETILAVSLRQASRGIVGAFLLALGRALGEGIAVFMVIGRQDNQRPEQLFSLRPLIEAGQTLTTKLVSSETHIAYGDPLHWAAIVSLGVLLLAFTATLTWIALRCSGRKEHHAADP